MKEFETGKTYTIGVTNRYARFHATVISRTAKTVTFQLSDRGCTYLIDDLSRDIWHPVTLRVNNMQTECYGMEVVTGMAGDGRKRSHVSACAEEV